MVYMIERNRGITCVCFMGGDAHPEEVNELAKAKEEFNELRKSTKSELSSRKDSHQKLSITEPKKSRGR